MQVDFKELAVGDKFVHWSGTTMEKIERTSMSEKMDARNVFYTAKYLDGENAGKMCCITDGTIKTPNFVEKILN